jgi:hypothetical protein
MPTNYAPVQGQHRVIDPEASAVHKLPLSVHPRAFPAGTPMWLNQVAGRYQAEPALISTVNATIDLSAADIAVDSGYATLALANVVFAPLFLGLALEGRVPQQMQTLGAFSVPAPWVNYAADASRPFLPICTRGQAMMKLDIAAAAAVEFGTLVQVAGFAQDAHPEVGFYDPAGILQNEGAADYWLYLNAVNLDSVDPTGCIGFVCERAEIGSPEVKVQFYSAYNNAVLTLGK